MTTPPVERVDLDAAHDLLSLRSSVDRAAEAIGLGRVDRTKVATAAVELGRNAIVHGGGGQAVVETCSSPAGREGVRIVVTDRGPGIPDVEQALVDGFSTNGGMGLGLGGARRLVNEFVVDAAPGGGTRATLVRWA